jgi:FKBP-type peptidyl-prolyl cis-trans isomerase FkpA
MFKQRFARFCLVVASAAALGMSLGGCDKKDEPPPGPPREAPKKDEFKTEDVKVGTGAEAKDGSTVKVHYVGTLKSGERFDSSRDRGEPFEFTIGKGGVILGWEKGVAGMKVGGLRKLTIPSELGYGSAGQPPKIPAYATLLFEIELLEVK